MANPIRRRYYWTEEEENILRELWYDADITEEDLEKVFNRSTQALRQKAYRMKLPRRNTLFGTGLNREYLARLLTVVEG